MRLTLAAALIVIALAAVPAAALADRSASSNWAGYAVHGTDFARVSARWRQPRAVCAPGSMTYSAIWVGLGGFSLSSGALEQVGTELDCNAGHPVSSAWYELVPAASHTLALRVRPGDVIAASVFYAAGRVTVTLSNLTRHRTFRRTLHPPAVDVSSAEWILEAPSACIGGTSYCRTLPLTDFGTMTFTDARARAADGRLGTISARRWVRTRIALVPAGEQFVTERSGGVPFGTARPSALSRNGGSFSVSYRRVYVPASALLAARRQPRGPVSLRHGRLG